MIDESELGIELDTLAPQAEQLMSAKRAIAITVVFFLVQLFLGFCIGIAAGVYFGITGKGTTPAVISDLMTPLVLPISMIAMAGAGLIAFRMTRKTLRGPIGQGTLTSLGWRPSATSSIAAAAFTGCALSLIYLFILMPVSPPVEGQQWGPIATAASGGGWPRIFWAILLLALAPPIEEFIFRGVLFAGLSNGAGIRTATLIVTVVFVLLHLSETLAYWPAWVAISLLACATIFFRIKTESLVPAIAAHAGYNLALVLVVFFYSA